MEVYVIRFCDDRWVAPSVRFQSMNTVRSLGHGSSSFSSDSRIKKILVVSSDEFDRNQLKSAGFGTSG